MTENIIINAAPSGGQNAALGNEESTLEKLLKYAIYAVILGLVITVIVAAYLLIDNWEWVVTSTTTGVLGWLNPFDDDEGDEDPIESTKEKYWDTPLSFAWWWPPNWFS
jgi:hypothetical protein